MVCTFGAEILRLTGFALEMPVRLAGAVQAQAVLKDGKRVADFPGFTAESDSGPSRSDTQN
jgi:hypothetical protein